MRWGWVLQVGGAQLHANATRTSAAQAQAALQSLDTSRGAVKEGIAQVSSLAEDLHLQQAGGSSSEEASGGGEGNNDALTSKQSQGQSNGGKGATKEWEKQRQAVAGTDASHAAHVESFALGEHGAGGHGPLPSSAQPGGHGLEFCHL